MEKINENEYDQSYSKLDRKQSLEHKRGSN